MIWAFVLRNWQFFALGAAVIGLVAFGYSKGIEHGKIEQLKDSADALRNRGDINRTIRAMDDYNACITVGGLPDQCTELRGLGTESQTK